MLPVGQHSVAHGKIRIDVQIEREEHDQSQPDGERRPTNRRCDDDTPLVWILRDTLALTGTKFGCGVGVCGSCPVLENGRAVRSCQIPAGDAKGRSFVTIEGLSRDGNHPCQRAWLEEDVAQCGFCQPGMILSACALLHDHPEPTDEVIDTVMSDSFAGAGHIRASAKRSGAPPRKCAPKIMITSRRAFLKTAALGGASLIIGFDSSRLIAGAESKTGDHFKPNNWVTIDPHGMVTLTIGKSEMGQGVRTSLAMILAEELDADWSRIKLVQASPGPVFDDLGTGGSDSVRDGWRTLRKAGAAAREMLTSAAAARWKVDRANCAASNGAVVHMPTGRQFDGPRRSRRRCLVARRRRGR